MHTSIAAEYPEINYKKMYQGHKCFIDMDNEIWHDTSDLVEFPNLDQFLDLYRNCGLNEKHWDWENIVKSSPISTLQNMCVKCPHSENSQSTTKKIYYLPNTKERYVSCPLETHFADGVEVHLDYLPRFNIVCNHCNQVVDRPYCGKTSNLAFFDVRLKGSPAKLIVYRRHEICPHCQNHLAVDLIPRIQVDSKYQMSIRLIHAINDYSINKGISGFCQKHIAQGYGISYELLKKFYTERFQELRIKAERAYLDYAKYCEEEKACTDFSFQCITPNFSLLLCFSEIERDTVSSEFCLCAAFDKKEIDVIDSWMHGNFSPSFTSKLTDRHLDFLAGHYTGIAFPNINYLFAFRMVQLTIAYGKELKKLQNATKDPMTPDLANCLRALFLEDMSYSGFTFEIDQTAEWGLYLIKSQKVYRAARSVLTVLKKLRMDRRSNSLRKIIQVDVPLLSEKNRNQAKRIAHLIERSLHSSAQQQAESEEATEESYATNSDLAILRLLYVNPAVTYDHQDGSYMGTPLYGVPASALEELLKNGLLDDQGHPLADLADNIPIQ